MNKSGGNKSQSSNNSDLLVLESDEEDLIDYVAENSSVFNTQQNQQKKSQSVDLDSKMEEKQIQELQQKIQVEELEDEISQISLSNLEDVLNTQKNEMSKEVLEIISDQKEYDQEKLSKQSDQHNEGKEETKTKSRYSNTYKNPALHYVAHKAGMNTIDKDKIQKLIVDASKNSDYYKREMERTETAKERAKELRKKIDTIKKNESLWNKKQNELKMLFKEIEQERQLDRTWIYIDMDMFYAAVEIKDNPSLADKPIAVGSESMISTANYVARQFGVRSAMPGFIGKKLCPDLIFVQHDFSKYKSVAKVFKSIIEEYDSEYESMGLDEASADVTNYLLEKNLKTDEETKQLAEQIRNRINEETQLTCSGGIACNRMLAKICSDFNKPNGQTYLESDSDKILEFMSKLSVRKIPGIGRMTELTLASLDIYTCQDILDKDIEIYIAFNERTSRWLFRSALGIARCEHEDDDDDGIQKSISVSSTFKPIVKYEQFKEKLSELSLDLAYRMDKRKVAGMTLTVEFKNTKFQVVQKYFQQDQLLFVFRSTGLNSYIWTYEDIFKFSTQILDSNWPIDPLRLMGVKLSNLKSQHEVKKDKSLNEFFKQGLSREQYEQQNAKQLSTLQKQNKVQPAPKSRKSSQNKSMSSSNNNNTASQSNDLGRQQRISSFVVATKLSESKQSSSSNNNETHQENQLKSQTEVNTKKRPLQKKESPLTSKKAKKGKKDKKSKNTTNSGSLDSFFSSKKTD